jgi:hypothetical protein
MTMTKESPPSGSDAPGLWLALACWCWVFPGLWLMAQPSKSGCSSPRRDIANLRTSIEMYQVARGHSPATVEDLLEAGVIAKATKDRWGHAYLIVCLEGTGPCGILSAGRDGTFGTHDDVRSW